MGIPLIETITEYEQLNEFLNQKDILLIIKIHPMQELLNLKISDRSNIKVLTGIRVKKLGVDNFRLMACCDAMISDYSAAAYDFLQLNKPIAYVLSDMNEYKPGFVVDDIHTFLAGHEIYTLEDMLMFLHDIDKNNDTYKDKREKIRDFVYAYHDGNNSKRLAEFIGL